MVKGMLPKAEELIARVQAPSEGSADMTADTSCCGLPRISVHAFG